MAQPTNKPAAVAAKPTAPPAGPPPNLAALITELQRIVADPCSTRGQLIAAKRAVFAFQRGPVAPTFDANTQASSNQTRARVADDRFARIVKALSH